MIKVLPGLAWEMEGGGSMGDGVGRGVGSNEQNPIKPITLQFTANMRRWLNVGLLLTHRL